MFLSEGEFGGKIESAILSLLNILVRMQSLTLGSPSSLWLLEGGKDHSALAILMLFLFASVTSHYQSQGHGLDGPFDLTYVAILMLSI